MNDSGCLWVLLIIVVVAILLAVQQQKKLSAMSPEERAAYAARQRQASASLQWGPSNANMICPHCQKSGHVHTKGIEVKKGISGGKATAAVLTGGVSLLATGLSRKEAATQAHCDNCGSTWQF
jgi:hypothetical protein